MSCLEPYGYLKICRVRHGKDRTMEFEICQALDFTYFGWRKRDRVKYDVAKLDLDAWAITLTKPESRDNLTFFNISVIIVRLKIST